MNSLMTPKISPYTPVQLRALYEIGYSLAHDWTRKISLTHCLHLAEKFQADARSEIIKTHKEALTEEKLEARIKHNQTFGSPPAIETETGSLVICTSIAGNTKFTIDEKGNLEVEIFRKISPDSQDSSSLPVITARLPFIFDVLQLQIRTEKNEVYQNQITLKSEIDKSLPIASLIIEKTHFATMNEIGSLKPVLIKIEEYHIVMEALNVIAKIIKDCNKNNQSVDIKLLSTIPKTIKTREKAREAQELAEKAKKEAAKEAQKKANKEKKIQAQALKQPQVIPQEIKPSEKITPAKSVQPEIPDVPAQPKRKRISIAPAEESKKKGR